MNYNKMPSPATLEDMSLGTSNLAPAMVAPKSQQVTLADVYALDIRTIINKSLYAYLVNFGIFYFDLDAMIFSPADSDMVMALKQTALQAGVDVAGAWVRTQYPNMVI